MSKKQKELEKDVTEQELNAEKEISEGVVSKDDKKQDKKSKDNKNDKNDKKKNKQKKEKKGGIGKKTKETISELKKVTWPSFGEVVKKTGIVIAFVLIFGLFMFGVNALLAGLVGLLV